MTGFEPATTRPPDAYSTELSYIPLFCFWWCKDINLLEITNEYYVKIIADYLYPHVVPVEV